MDNLNQSPTVSSVNNQSNSSGKAPWPWWATFIFSAVSGLYGGYIIVWLNLKRLGKHNVAKKFLFIGGGIVILILGFLILLGQILPSITLLFSARLILSLILGLLFPTWLYFAYLKKWQTENPGKAKFSWSIIGWTAIGIVIGIVSELVFLSLLLFRFW